MPIKNQTKSKLNKNKNQIKSRQNKKPLPNFSITFWWIYKKNDSEILTKNKSRPVMSSL